MKLPTIVLLISGSSLFLFQASLSGFEVGHHGNLSSHGMALARNLITGNSPTFMYNEIRMKSDGEVTYEAYNRFPIVPFWIIALAILPFEPAFSNQIYAARQLMNLFFIAAMLFTFLLVTRLTRDSWQAAAITILSFSTYYLLFYHDLVFNDIPSLAAFMLAIWIVAKNAVQPMSAMKLISLSALPVAFGWQPLAVFGVWVTVDLVSLAWSHRISVQSVIRRPAVVAACSAVVFGGTILFIQLLNESRVTGTAITDSATFQSMKFRVGIAEMPADLQTQSVSVDLVLFLRNEVFRVLSSMAPFSGLLRWHFRLKWAVAMILFVLASLSIWRISRISKKKEVLLPFSEQPLVWSVILLSGPVWAILMKNFVFFHDFQAIYYVGISIAFFTAVVQLCRPKIVSVTIVSAALFISCVAVMDRNKALMWGPREALTEEFQMIQSQLPRNSRTYIDLDPNLMGVHSRAVDYFTSGVVRTLAPRAEYAISDKTVQRGKILTQNSHVNLYRLDWIGHNVTGSHYREY